MEAYKTNIKANQIGGALWYISFISGEVIEKHASLLKALCNWVLHHTLVVQSPIANGWLKVSIDDHSEAQPVPKLLL